MRYHPVVVIAAGLAMMPAAAMAQDYHGSVEQAPTEGEAAHPAPEHGLSAEQRAAYASWPENVKAYYQSLSGKRQAIFWTLPDSDKVALATMSDPDAEAAWQMAESKAMPERKPAEPMDPQPEI